MIGQLQFEVVEHRRKAEYGVGVVFERAGTHTTRWVTCDDVSGSFAPRKRTLLRPGH